MTPTWYRPLMHQAVPCLPCCLCYCLLLLLFLLLQPAHWPQLLY
jgi:hypothetical protein